MKKTTTAPYDVAEHLRTADEMAAYLEACLEEAGGDAAFIAKTLGDIARAKGMAQVARGRTIMRHVLFTVLVLVTSLLPTGLGAQPRDLSKLDACKILTSADVAATTKRKVIQSVGGAVHCGYVVEAPQSGADTYDFFLNEASMVEALLGVQTATEKGTAVPGLWSEAYVGPAIGSKQLRLVALQRGVMAIEIQGPNKDVLIALAMVVVSRLR